MVRLPVLLSQNNKVKLKPVRIVWMLSVRLAPIVLLPWLRKTLLLKKLRLLKAKQLKNQLSQQNNCWLALLSQKPVPVSRLFFCCKCLIVGDLCDFGPAPQIVHTIPEGQLK